MLRIEPCTDVKHIHTHTVEPVELPGFDYRQYGAKSFYWVEIAGNPDQLFMLSDGFSNLNPVRTHTVQGRYVFEYAGSEQIGYQPFKV